MAEVGASGGNSIGVRPADPRGSLKADLVRRQAQARPAPVHPTGTASAARGLEILRERSAQSVTARKQEIRQSPIRPQEVPQADIAGASEVAARAIPTVADRLRSGSRGGFSSVVGGVLDVQG